MEKIFQDPTFLEQPEDVRLKAVNNYFNKHIAADPEFQKLDEASKKKVYDNFIKINARIEPKADPKIITQAAKTVPELRQKLISEAEKIAQSDFYKQNKDKFEAIKRGEFVPQETTAPRPDIEQRPSDPSLDAAYAERAVFEYSQLADTLKAFYQQYTNGKIDPELEAKLDAQREKALKVMVESFDRKGYDLIRVDDKLYAVDRKTGEKQPIDRGTFRNILNGLLTSKYEIATATGGAIAGAKIGARLGIPGMIVGGVIGSALGAAGGAAADYIEATDRTGIEAKNVLSQANQAMIADLLFNTLTLGAMKGVGYTLKGAKAAGRFVNDKLTELIEKPALNQMYKDLGISKNEAEKWYKEFIDYYDFKPKSEQEKRRLKALAIALRHPQAKATILSAISSNPKAAINISKEIHIRAQQLEDMVKKFGYTPAEAARAVDLAGKRAGQLYAEAESAVKEALSDIPFDVKVLNIDSVLDNIRKRAGDPAMESKVSALKETLRDIIDNGGKNAATLMEVRKQLNDFYRRNRKRLTYAPDKKAVAAILNSIDDKIEKALDFKGRDDLKSLYWKAVDEYKDYAKARDSKLYTDITREGIPEDQAQRAYVKRAEAIDDTFVKFLKPLKEKDREKAELGAIRAMLESGGVMAGGGKDPKAIDWDSVMSHIRRIKKSIKSEKAKAIIDVAEKLDKFFYKDPDLQSVASRTTTKTPNTIAERLMGKIQQTWNKFRYDMLLRNYPKSEYSRRLKYKHMIEKALETERPLRNLIDEAIKNGDEELKKTAKALKTQLRFAEAAKNVSAKGKPLEQKRKDVLLLAKTHPATVGALIGFEQDKDGNWHYNVEKGILGAAGGALAGKALSDKEFRKKIVDIAKKEAEKIHDKWFNSKFGPPKITGDDGVNLPKSRQEAKFYLKSKKVLEKVKNQTFTPEQLINYLKKNGVKDEEIEWVVEPVIEGMKKIKVADIYDKLRPPNIYDEIGSEDIGLMSYKDRYTHIKSGYRNIITKFDGADVGWTIYRPISVPNHWTDSNVLYHKRLSSLRKKEATKEAKEAAKEAARKEKIDHKRYLYDTYGITNLRKLKYEKIIDFRNLDSLADFVGKRYKGRGKKKLIENLNKLKEVLGKYQIVKRDKIYEIFPKAYSDFTGFDTSSKRIHLADLNGENAIVIGLANQNRAGRGIIIPIDGINISDEIEKLLKKQQKTKNKKGDTKTYKSLIIEELQSDWHKDGAKEGYFDVAAINRLNNKKKELHSYINKILEKYNIKRIMFYDLELDDVAGKIKKDFIKKIKNLDERGEIEFHKIMNKAEAGKIDDKDIKRFADKYNIDRKKIHSVAAKIAEISKDKSKIARVLNIIDAIKTRKSKLKGNVPNAPFKKTWHEKALKDVILEAANKDYDRIYWTGSYIQSKRYDLGEYLNSLTVSKNLGGGYDINGVTKDNKMVTHMAKDKDELENAIGKAMADKILSELKNKDEVTLRSEELYLPKDGMVKFYDKMIPLAVKKILKRFKVEPKRQKLKGEWYWYIDLTPEMREYIRKNGLPFFTIPITVSIAGAINKENE